MNEESAGVDVEIETPHRHHPTGHHWLDKVLPVSAFFISLISIWIAFHHGEVMQELVNQNERLVQANSLPHLTVSSSFLNDDVGRSRSRFQVVNGGVGPAEIRTIEMRLDNQPVRNARELLAKCCGITSGDGLVASDPTGRMVRAGEALTYFDLRQMNDAAKPGMNRLYEALQGRIATRVCYCSVFEECWTADMDVRRPKRVEQCPAVPVPYGR